MLNLPHLSFCYTWEVQKAYGTNAEGHSPIAKEVLNVLKSIILNLAAVVYTFYPSTMEAEAGESL